MQMAQAAGGKGRGVTSGTQKSRRGKNTKAGLEGKPPSNVVFTAGQKTFDGILRMSFVRSML